MSSSQPESRDFVARLGDAFAAIAGWSFDFRWLVLLGFLAVVAGATVLAGGAQPDNSYENYFDPDDTAYTAYEQYREDFGSDEVSYILYEVPGAEHGPFDLEAMRQIAELTERIESEVPFVYEADSPANAELTIGVEDGIEIRKLTDEFPETQEELLALREQFLAKPLLVGGLISEDAKYGAIIVDMDRSSTDPPEDIIWDPEKGEELENLYPQVTDAALESLLAEYPDITFYHSGDVPMNAFFNRVIVNESMTLQGMTSLLIALVLLVVFRSFVGAFAPIVGVFVTVIFVTAFIAVMGWKLGISFSSTPTLLTAIGVAHAVHIFSEFRLRFAELRDRRAALVDTVRLVGVPCLLTAVTTAVGFASLGTTPIPAIARGGIYQAFGVLIAFFISLTLLMAILSFGRKEPRSAAVSQESDLQRRVLLGVARFDQRYRVAILASFGAFFIACVVGLVQVVPDSNWLDDFHEDTPLRLVTEKADSVMGGVTNIIFLFDAGEAEAIKEPAALRELERVQQTIDGFDGANRKTYSIVDILKDLNQAFHGGDPAYYIACPRARELVAQYLLLYEMSGGEQAEEYVSSDYRRATVEVRIALGRTSKTGEIVDHVNGTLAANPLEATTSELTGIGALWLKLMDYIVSSQTQGFLTAFGVIAVLMVLIFRSFSVGMISMVPNLAPAIVGLGVMGWLDIPLDYNKVSIAGIALGIAVDDTIHLMIRYRYEFQRLGNYQAALEAAMSDVGRALIITSVALVIGFSALLGSQLASQATYGMLLSATILTALVADFLLMPALIQTFKPFGPEFAGAGGEAALQEAA